MRFRLFIPIIGYLLSHTVPSVASDWRIVDQAAGKGSNAMMNVYLSQAEKPTWSTLILDFSVSRRCTAGLGFMMRTARDLGSYIRHQVKSDGFLNVSVDGRRWVKPVELVVFYQNGFEMMSAIYEQDLLDRLGSGSSAEVILTSEGKRRLAVKFPIKGGSTAINSAYNRCLNMN